MRPWVLGAWLFLTLGITAGSYWAYYELGWGGWWFWDPVENASLMPWLAATALLHSASVLASRNALRAWAMTQGHEVTDRPYEAYKNGIDEAFTENGQYDVYWTLKQ